MNIAEAGDKAVEQGKKDLAQLVLDVKQIEKLNDQELLTLTNNAERMAQRTNPKAFESAPKSPADIIDMKTQETVPPEGIASLTEKAGQKAPPGTLMGNLESRIKQLEASGEDLSKMKGQTLDDIMRNEGQAQKGMAQSQKEGLVRATANDIMIADMKSGKFPITKEMQQEILEGSPKSLDYFRRFYGEDALEVLDSLGPDLAKMRSSREAAEFAKKQYNFEAKMDRAPGSFDPEDPEEFAVGGRVGFNEGTLDPAKEKQIKQMIKMGADTDTISTITGATPQQIQNIQQNKRVGMAGGGILKLAMKFFNDNNPLSAYKKYLKYVKETAQKDPAKLAPEVGGIVAGSELIHRGLRRKLKEVKEKNNENDSEGFAMGGRVSYAYGSGLKLIQLLNKAKKSLKKAIKESVDDIIPTGDSKLDADMAVDNMLEKLGVDRDAVDGYDILDAYGEAYKTVTDSMLKTRKSASVFSETYLKKIDDEIIEEGLYTRKEWAKAPETIKNKIRGQMDPDWKEANFGEDYDFDQVRGKELEEGIGGLQINMNDVMDDVRLMKEKGLQSGKPGDYDKFLEMKLSGELGPQKQMQTIKMELFNKYSKYLDDETMDVIQASNDPQKVAEAYANVREAALLSDRGVPTEEIVDTIIKAPRTKQADGTGSQGLNYLLGF